MAAQQETIMSKLQKEISELLNKHSKENESDSSDFVLTEYLASCLEVFETVIAPKLQSQGQRISSEKTDMGAGVFVPDLRKPGDRRQENTEFQPPDKRQALSLDRRKFPIWSRLE